MAVNELCGFNTQFRILRISQINL